MEKCIDLINNYWRFDNNQQPISTWHDKQDLIEKLSNAETEIHNKAVQQCIDIALKEREQTDDHAAYVSCDNIVSTIEKLKNSETTTLMARLEEVIRLLKANGVYVTVTIKQ